MVGPEPSFPENPERKCLLIVCPICLDRKLMCNELWVFPCMNCFGFGRRLALLPLNPWFRAHAVQRLTPQQETDSRYATLTDTNGNPLRSLERPDFGWRENPPQIAMNRAQTEAKFVEDNIGPEWEDAQINAQWQNDGKVDKNVKFEAIEEENGENKVKIESEVRVYNVFKEKMKMVDCNDGENVKNDKKSVIKTEKEELKPIFGPEPSSPKEDELKSPQSHPEVKRNEQKQEKPRDDKAKRKRENETGRNVHARDVNRVGDGKGAAMTSVKERPWTRSRNSENDWNHNPIPQLLEMRQTTMKRHQGVKKWHHRNGNHYNAPRNDVKGKHYRRYNESYN